MDNSTHFDSQKEKSTENCRIDIEENIHEAEPKGVRA